MTRFSKKTTLHSTPNPLTKALEELRRTGKPIVDLTISNPTKCGFSYLSSDLLKPLSAPENLSYDPEAQGLRHAREAIAKDYAAKGCTVDPDQIFLTASTSEAYSFIFTLLADPNDFILSPQPGYPLLDYLIGYHDLKTRSYSLSENHWQPQILEIKTLMDQCRPKALLVVNPGNPNGGYIDPGYLNQSGHIEIPWIADEVFFDYCLDDQLTPTSFVKTNPDRLCFTLSGLSKVLGLPQMKLSWIILTGPKKLVAEATARLELIADTYLSLNTPSQNALSEWLILKAPIQAEISTRIKQNLVCAEKLVLEKGPIQIDRPSGGWSLVLTLPEACSDELWALSLLKEKGVLVHPGYFYDMAQEHYVVISLLTEPNDFEAGLQRIILHQTS